MEHLLDALLTVFIQEAAVLLAAAVYFAGRSIHRRKGCGGNCAGCSGCPHRPSHEENR